MSHDGELTPGTLLGRYRITRLLGRGGMGAVYAAEQSEDGRQVAVKVLTSGLSGETDRERFLREGALAASIDHPNVVYVYRTEEVDGQPLIAMELVAGETLEEKVARRGPLPVDEAIEDVLQVVDGLEAAARVGVMHRDVKPANCFVGASGVVKVGDFGLSRPVEQADAQRLTQSGIFLGTPVFSSPEQLMGEPLDLRADIYSVGATLYFLLTGSLPFEGDNSVRLIAQVMSGASIPLASHRRDLPEDVVAVVMRCLERRREDRFASYEQLREALQACRTVSQDSAPLGRRAAAGMLDVFAVTALSMAISASLGLDGRAMAGGGSVAQAGIGAGIALLLSLGWFAVAEARWGASPAKFLLSLRVTRLQGGNPTLRQSAMRTAIVWLPATVMSLVTSSAGTAVSSLAWTAALASLFVRARRDNGFAAEQDRRTGTRVVRAGPERGEPATPVMTPAPSATPHGSERIGEFEVLGTLRGSTRVVVAEDPILRRTVWIVRRDDDVPPLSEDDRGAVRPGCLRWIAGRRVPGDAWDAYAAREGETLAERLARPAEWREVRRWLSNLARELLARREPDREAMQLTARHVWITAEGGAILLPFAVGEAPRRRPDAEGLFPDVLSRLEDADGWEGRRAAWPLGADRVLETIRRAPKRVGDIVSVLETTGTTNDAMRARHRLMMIGMPVSVVALWMVGQAALGAQRNPRDPEPARTVALLSYLRRPPWHELAPTSGQRRLVELYIAGRARDVVASRGGGRQTLADKGLWRLGDSLLAVHVQVSAEDARQAEHLVESEWRNRPPGQPNRAVQAGLTGFAAMVANLAVIHVLIALAVRRGIVTRAMRLEFVTRRRARASRVRLLWRQLIVWSAPLALVMLAAIAVNDGLAVVLIPAFLIAAPLVVGVWSALRHPARGIAERLSGTWIVPE